MAKALHKVQKQISKKRGGKSNTLHENSRDSQRLRTAGAREDKIAKLVAAASRANQTYGVANLRYSVDRHTDSIFTKWIVSHSFKRLLKNQRRRSVRKNFKI
jgi:Translation machinery-associated protein 16